MRGVTSVNHRVGSMSRWYRVAKYIHVYLPPKAARSRTPVADPGISKRGGAVPAR